MAGCQVNTRIAIDAVAGGRGVVAVTVTLDAAAAAAIGGQGGAWRPSCRTRTWWQPDGRSTGPTPGPGSTTVISASHPFATPAEASALVGELAGDRADGSRPFRLSVSRTASFWRTDTTLTGTVDLTCGLACFGDSGLDRALGSPVGVNPAPLESAAGQSRIRSLPSR